MAGPLLPQDQIRRLHETIVSIGGADNRADLLAGLDPAFFKRLPGASDSSAQIFRDLNELNRIERLSDGTVPLKVWLENAVHLFGPRVEVLKKIMKPATPIPAPAGRIEGKEAQA